MSRFQKVKDELLSKQFQTPAQSTEVWLDFGEAVEVLCVDAEDTPYLVVGEYQGISVPEGGGPTDVIVKTDDGLVKLHTEEVVGMTKR